MTHPVLVERLLNELTAARAAIAASYQRLWLDAERTLRASEPRDPADEASLTGDAPGTDDALCGP